MFLRRRSAPAEEPTASAPIRSGEGSRPATYVSRESRLRGRLTGTTDLVLEGELAGEIAIEGELTVTATGRVEGPVDARAAVISGRVHGDVRGGERIEVLAGGLVEGNLAARRVVLAEGSVLNGRVDVLSADAKARS